MEDIKKAVAVLGALILAHHRRIRAYSSLYEMTSHQEIKSSCERHIGRSQQIIKNLSMWRSGYGGFAKKLDGFADGNTWHLVRLFLSFNTEKTAISRCMQLDRDTLKTYKQAMSAIPPAAAGDLQGHVREMEKMMLSLQELVERKQEVGSLAIK